MAKLKDGVESHAEEMMAHFGTASSDSSTLLTHGCLTLAQCAMLLPSLLKTDEPSSVATYITLALIDVAHEDLTALHPDSQLAYSEYLRLSRMGVYGTDAGDQPLPGGDWLVTLDEAQRWMLSKGHKINFDAVRLDLERLRVNVDEIAPGASQQNQEPPKTLHMASEDEIVNAFRCRRDLFKDGHKFEWVRKAKQKGRGGRVSVAPKYDPFLFAVNLPGTSYVNGLTETASWRLLETHFPDRYDEVSYMDPKSV